MTTSVELIHGLYDYHFWANRRLREAAVALGDAACAREVGKQFSFPTLKGMLAHVHGADDIWFARFAGVTTGRLLGDADFADLAALGAKWDALETRQREFLEPLTPADLARPITYTSALVPDRKLTLPLASLLQHVTNHATHHRSELATMITMISGSPPGTDRAVYELVVTGQLPPEHPGWR